MNLGSVAVLFAVFFPKDYSKLAEHALQVKFIIRKSK